MPQEEPRKTSLVVPILLIAFGALFLLRNWNPGFEPFHVLRNWWPLILILVGLGKIWDFSRNRASGQASSGVALGSTLGVVAFVLVIVILVGHYQKRRHGFTASADDHSDHEDFASHAEQVVELQGAKSVYAELKMAAGQMNLSGGSSHLLNSRFQFNRKWDSPKVDYSVADGKGRLEVSQDQGSGLTFGPSDCTWDLNFSDEVPLELRIETGAAQGNFRLRNVDLRSLDIQMGVGQVDVDLTGPRQADLNVEIKGGIGQARIRLPRDVGVTAYAKGGIGSINAGGLQKDGDEYHNDVYGKTKHKIHLDVEGGIGQIDLIQE